MIKRLVQGIAFLLTGPSVLLCGCGRFRLLYSAFAQLYALAPGIPGDYLRIAFYRGTLEECALDSRVSFGSYFAHPEARVGERVYIGSYCILGRVSIGGRTQIASAVQVLSGKSQHTRLPDGSISGSGHGTFVTVSIGSDCWIGAAAVVMADIGNNTTIGAGAIVTKPIPANTTAVGNPARVI